LILNTFYISRLGSGISLFSGFFKVNLINQSMEFMLLIISGLILFSLISNVSRHSGIANFNSLFTQKINLNNKINLSI
jgi:hypothetical protein